MGENSKPFYMDQKGYDELRKEIRERNNGLKAMNSQMEVEAAQIALLQQQLLNAQIIEEVKDENLVNLDDIVALDVKFDDEYEEMTVKLVGGNSNFRAEIQEISVNTALGAAIYRQPIGVNCSYISNGKEIPVLIKSKVDVLENEQNQQVVR